jgi:aspartyl-tRNA(Asn)/glutamyl-tRNA(Gln) amidotransferase subunit C
MITRTELEHLAKLARIKLEDSDKESLLREFDSILGYIDELKKVDVKLDSSGRIGNLHNVVREDNAYTISEEDRDRILAEAPDREGDFVAVKKIIAEDIKI